jgi:hypothetical protein
MGSNSLIFRLHSSQSLQKTIKITHQYLNSY